MSPLASAIDAAEQFIRGQTRLQPRVGLILGSGLGELFAAAEASVVLPYDGIPNFPRPTVPGHQGELVLTQLAGQPIAVLRGRVHLYEGYSPADVAFPVRLLARLGCSVLVVTNAAGGLNPSYRPGDFMLISDHIFLPGMVGASPLLGPLVEQPGPRFVSLANAYDWQLRQQMLKLAEARGIGAWEGVYVMVAGPHYETPAELRMLRLLGGDAVGMSTCPEVLAARQLGLRVLGLSVIANSAVGDDHRNLNHAEVLASVAAAEPQMAELLCAWLAQFQP